MQVTKCQFYRSSLALLIWLQKIERFVATRYDIDLPEMKYLASNLSPLECYDFYNLLSHRRAMRGQISIYAIKEKAREISCINLLATWITDPSESMYRSDENIELKLRQIGRKDLARWVLGVIDSRLRRRLDAREINRDIEETELNDVVRNRIGERIIPINDDADNAANIDANSVVEDRQAGCIFWKVFFSCLILLLLVVLFLCFYRFLYTKLRCICGRFDVPEAKDYRLPEQTYGTTSCSDLPSCNGRGENFELPKVVNNHEIVNFATEEKKNGETEWKVTERSLSADFAKKFKLDVPRKSKIYFPPAPESKHQLSASTKEAEELRGSRKILKNVYPAEFEKFNYRRALSSRTIDGSRKIDATGSEFVSSAKENEKIVEKGKFARINTFCGFRGDEEIHGKLENWKNSKFSSLESLTELSETYDELGMLFSELFKRQWRPCRRKYCPLTRRLKGSRGTDHDWRKCRGRINCARNIVLNWDQRPACSSGNICRETYDEYKIMTANGAERKILARSIIERRKSFLNQPCLSPSLTESREESKN